MHHPTADELYSAVFDQTPLAELTHLNSCPTCRQTVRELTALAEVLTIARLCQPSPAQYERYGQLLDAAE